MACNRYDRQSKPIGSYLRLKTEDEPFNAHHFFISNPSLSGRGSALYPDQYKTGQSWGRKTSKFKKKT